LGREPFANSLPTFTKKKTGFLGGQKTFPLRGLGTQKNVEIKTHKDAGQRPQTGKQRWGRKEKEKRRSPLPTKKKKTAASNWRRAGRKAKKKNPSKLRLIKGGKKSAEARGPSIRMFAKTQRKEHLSPSKEKRRGEGPALNGWTR